MRSNRGNVGGSVVFEKVNTTSEVIPTSPILPLCLFPIGIACRSEHSPGNANRAEVPAHRKRSASCGSH